MNKIMTAIALAVALPTVANAQAPQAPAKGAEMKEMCACCKGMAGMSGSSHGSSAKAHQEMGGGHAGHDMSLQSGKSAAADAHQNQKP